MSVLGDSTRGRRFVIVMGSDRYRDLPAGAALPRVASDVGRVANIFSGFGYRHVLPGFAEYATPDHVRMALGQWVRDVDLGEDDAVVFYFAGHGLVEERDRHYLLCWSSSEYQPAATALPTEDLVRILIGTGLRNLLVVLDTCYGGVGAADAAIVALQTVARRVGGTRTSTGLWFLTSARAKDEAADGAFVDVLQSAIDQVAARSGQRQQYLDLPELVGEINLAFGSRRLGQQAELVAGLVTGLAPFVPNPRFRRRLPPVGTDLEVQTRAAALDITEHFGPRSRGVEFESEQGMYFSGRVQALTELVAWLTGVTDDGRGRIVTGSPGCGKSAVLGRIVALSDPAYRATTLLAGVNPGTVAPENVVDVAVHARHKRLEEVVARFAADLGIAADTPAVLLHALGKRDASSPPIVAVIDALDEAGSGTSIDTGGRGEPRRIARDLLRPLSDIPGVRLLVGARRELVPSLGSAFHVLDLDEPEYRSAEDVADYVGKVLLAANEPDVRTPYRNLPDLASQIGAAIAERAGGVFLVARMASRSLRSAQEPIGTQQPGWMDRLPSEIGEAFDDYLARFGKDEERVRRLLVPLALAEGQGLPRNEVWLRLATALSGVDASDMDVGWVLSVAGAYVAEVTEQGRSVYRLYHQALAEHLRHSPALDPVIAQSRIVDALTSLVPHGTRDIGKDWFASDLYLLANLATHAAAACRIDDLATDPGFLLACDQLPLLRALSTARSDDALRVRNAYEQVAHRLTMRAPIGERAAYLQLSACRSGAKALAHRIDELDIPLSWSARWAWWSPTGVHRQLRGHEDAVEAVAVGSLDDRPVALTGCADGTARVWDLTTQRQLGAPLVGHDRVTAATLGEVGEYSLALTGGDDGTVRVFDLSTGQEFGKPLLGHTNRVGSIALGMSERGPVAVTASDDGTARVWDLTSRTQLGEPFTLHRSTVSAVAMGTAGSRPIAVTGGADSQARIWDLQTRQPVGAPLIGHADAVSAVTVAKLDDRNIVVTGSADGTVGIWDLATRQQIGEPLAAHVSVKAVHRRVRSVAVGVLEGEPILLTCGGADVRVWNLRTRRRIGQPLAGHNAVITGAALGEVNGRPMAVSAGNDRTARIWDLTAENPAAGHTGDIRAVASCVIDGRQLAVTGGYDTTARIWDLGVRRQLGRPLEGHSGPVTAVTIGELRSRAVAVTGSTDTTVRIWDCGTRQPLTAPLEGHTNAVSAVALGKYAEHPVVVSGSQDGTVRIWDLSSGHEITAPLTRHRGGVFRLASGYVDGQPVVVIVTEPGGGYVWAMGTRDRAPELIGRLEPDRKKPVRGLEAGIIAGRPVILLTGQDNVVRIWDVLRSCEIMHRIAGHTEWVRLAALGEYDSQASVVTVSADETLRFWDTASGRQLGPSMPIVPYGTVSVSWCGSRASASAIVCQRDVMRVWNLTTFRPAGEPLSGLDTEVCDALVARIDGADVAITGTADSTLRLHNLDTGEQVMPQLISERELTSAALVNISDAPNVVTGHTNGTMQVFDPGTGSRLQTMSGHTDWIRSLATAHISGRNFLISASDDATLRIWDCQTWQQVGEPLAGHTAYVMDVVVGETGNRTVAVSCSLDGTIRLWDVPSGQPIGDPIVRQDHGITALAVGKWGDQTILLAGDDEGRLLVWNLDSLSALDMVLPSGDEEISALWAGMLNGRASAIVGDTAGQLRIIAADNGALLTDIGLEAMIDDLALGPRGLLCIATDMGLVTLKLPRQKGSDVQ